LNKEQQRQNIIGSAAATVFVIRGKVPGVFFRKHTRQSLRIAAQWRRRSKIVFCRGLLSSEVELGWQGCGQKESPGQEYVMWCFSSKR
jgi:hypothetical protein